MPPSRSESGAPPLDLQKAAADGSVHADDLALATSAREPIIVHDPEEEDLENGRSTLTPDEDVARKSTELEKIDSNGKADAVPSIDAEQEGGKYGVRAVIGGFGIR